MVPYDDKVSAANLTLDAIARTNKSIILALKDVGSDGKVLYASPLKRGVPITKPELQKIINR